MSTSTALTGGPSGAEVLTISSVPQSPNLNGGAPLQISVSTPSPNRSSPQSPNLNGGDPLQISVSTPSANSSVPQQQILNAGDSSQVLDFYDIFSYRF